MTFLSTYLNPCFKIKKSISNKIKDKKVTKIGVIQKVHSLRRGGREEVIEEKTKTNRGRGSPSMCVCSLFKKKC